MSEEEKVKILEEQLKRLEHEEDAPVSEVLKDEIRRMGYSPDRRTWDD